jgi:geranylgeranyl pyrophosphate synthase
MHYACLNGGKRLRPLLVYSVGELFAVQESKLNALACAVEYIHCYSLIHDDLPAMDNDDLRRGKPTCHKVYGEANTILAGNALLTLAFEILTRPDYLEKNPLQIIQLLSEAVGHQGLLHGQCLDLNTQEQAASLSFLEQMHHSKTGALISASLIGAALACQATIEEIAALKAYGSAIGLAFQIQDDILDATGDVDTLGKNIKQDLKNQKMTFVTLLGLEEAKMHARAYHEKALQALDLFQGRGQFLRQLADFIIERVA